MALLTIVIAATTAWAPLFWLPQHVRHHASVMDDGMAPRRTMRSRFAETCARQWVQHAQRRGQLEVADKPELTAFAACKSCSDVIRLQAGRLAWRDLQKKETLIQFESLEAEIVDLPQRSRRIKARVACSGADLDDSALWRSGVSRLSYERLGLHLESFETEVDPEFGVRISGNATYGDSTVPLEMSLEPTRTDEGHLGFRAFDVKIPALEFPLSFFRTLASLYAQQLQVNPGFTVQSVGIKGNKVVADVLTQPPPTPAPSFFKHVLNFGHRMPWLLTNAKAPRVVVVAFAALAIALHLTAIPDHVWTLLTNAPSWTSVLARHIAAFPDHFWTLIAAATAFFNRQAHVAFLAFKGLLPNRSFLALLASFLKRIVAWPISFLIGSVPTNLFARTDDHIFNPRARRRRNWWRRTRIVAANIAENCWRSLLGIGIGGPPLGLRTVVS